MLFANVDYFDTVFCIDINDFTNIYSVFSKWNLLFYSLLYCKGYFLFKILVQNSRSYYLKDIYAAITSKIVFYLIKTLNYWKQHGKQQNCITIGAPDTKNEMDQVEILTL